MSASATEPQIVDDKSPICVPFIRERIQAHRESGSTRPFIIGLNGVQGVGKTTLVRTLAETLRKEEGLETLVCSIDDFYLTHDDQVALAASMPDNKLVQVRGEPGTHDMSLARAFLASILNGSPTRVPQYDKSLHNGQGDRVPRELWPEVNGPGQPKVQVLLLEGWCVGFRPLPPVAVAARYSAPSRTLKDHDPAHLLYVNERLADYAAVLAESFDAFVHVDALRTDWAYDWRREQEAALRARRGPDAAMSDDQVRRFVDAYYPAYELFTDDLRGGLFSDKLHCQLRLVVGKDRRVTEVIII